MLKQWKNFGILVGIVVQLSASVNIGVIYNDEKLGINNTIHRMQQYLLEMDIHVNLTINAIYVEGKQMADILQTVCSSIRNDTVAVVAVLPCSTLSHLGEYLAHLSLPVFGIHVDPCPLKMTLAAMFRVQRPLTSSHDVILDLLHAGGCIDTTLVTDQSEAEVYYLRRLLSLSYIGFSVTYIPKSSKTTPRDLMSWLSGATDAVTSCLVLMLGESNLQIVSHDLYSSGVLFEDHIAIVVPSYDFSSSDPLDGFSTFHDVLWLEEKLPGRNSEVRRLDYYIMQSILLLLQAVNSVADQFPTFTSNTHVCGDRLVEIPVTSEALAEKLTQYNTTKFDHNGMNVSPDYDILRLKFHNETVTSEHVARWSDEAGLVVNTDTQLFRESTQGLGNITLMIGTTESAPFVRKLPNNAGWEGFCVDMLDELAARLHFRYKIIQSPDKLWGAVDKDGNWNGVVEMTRKKDVHIGIGPISLTAEREQVVDFTKPYMEEGAGMILRRFEDTRSKLFRMFKPFSFSVWLAVAGAVLLVGLTLACVNHLSPWRMRESRPSSPQQGDVSNRSGKEMTASDNLWIVYESYMEQGAEISPPNISGRFILGFWWLFTILIVASYKANLVAFLTVTFEEKAIRSVHDLAAQTDMKPLVKQGTNLYTELQKGETETYRKLWNMMQDSPIVSTNAEGLELVKTGGYAFLGDGRQMELLRNHDCLNLMTGEVPFNVGGLGFIVPESSPLLEVLSFNIIQFQESGLLERWQQKWISAKDMCPKEVQSSSVQSLEIESAGGPFLVFAGTTILAFLCLGLEWAWFSIRDKQMCHTKTNDLHLESTQ